MSGNNRMRVVITGAVAAATLGSGLALAPAAEAATPMKTLAYNNAIAHIGDKYKWGAAGPSKFDCSGLVYWNYTRGKNYKTKWEKSHPGKPFPRTAQAQYNYSKKVAKKNRSVGDLVFFYGNGGVYHVGYYAGKGKVLHSPYTGARVRKEKIWTKYVKYGRIN